MLEKLTLSYQHVYHGCDEDALFGKCRTAISSILNVEADMGSGVNLGKHRAYFLLLLHYIPFSKFYNLIDEYIALFHLVLKFESARSRVLSSLTFGICNHCSKTFFFIWVNVSLLTWTLQLILDLKSMLLLFISYTCITLKIDPIFALHYMVGLILGCGRIASLMLCNCCWYHTLTILADVAWI